MLDRCIRAYFDSWNYLRITEIWAQITLHTVSISQIENVLLLEFCQNVCCLFVVLSGVRTWLTMQCARREAL